MRLSELIESAAPGLQLHRAFNSKSRTILPPQCAVGGCWHPRYPDGTLFWADPAVTARSGDLIIVRLRTPAEDGPIYKDPSVLDIAWCKRLTLRDGAWWLECENEPPAPLRKLHKITAVVVASYFPPEGFSPVVRAGLARLAAANREQMDAWRM